jgi:hypothetical protein
VSEYRLLRGVAGPQRDDDTGGWRKLYMCTLQKIFIRMIKSRMRRAGHVALIGEIRKSENFGWKS